MDQDKHRKKIRFLHITDSHLAAHTSVGTFDIKTPTDGIEHPSRPDVLRDTVRNLALHLKEQNQTLDAVIISGDSALKGDGYGQTMLRTMLFDLLTDVGVTESNIVATPGNHDVVFGTKPGSPERYALFTKAWLEPTPVVVPFLDGVHQPKTLNPASHVLVDPNRDWAIFPINSSNWSQICITPDKNRHIALLMDHLKKMNNPELDSALTALRSYDVARVSEEQLDVLREAVKAVGDIRLRIAVLHHHLLPVGREEFKPFADITNLGALRQVLRDLGFDLVIHGHKHTATAYYDHIYSEHDPSGPAHRILTISGGTFGPTSLHPDNPLRVIEIDDVPYAPICILKNIRSAEPGRPPCFTGSSPYALWEESSSNDGPISLFGKSIDELYARAIQAVKANPNRTMICTIDFGSDDSPTFPHAYPYSGDASEKGEWFKETVRWWQISASRSENRIPYIHGNRLRRFGGGFDQIKRVVDLIKQRKPTSRALALVVDPARDFHGNKPFASFCLVQFCLKSTNSSIRLECIGYYRAQEFNHWWPINVAELRHLQLEVAKQAAIAPGHITTICPYPRLSSDIRQPTKVAVPLIDQWLDNHPARIAQIALAIAGGENYSGLDDGARLWTRVLDDLEQAATVYHEDGVPVAIEGLDLLKEWIAALNPQSPSITLFDDLVRVNKTLSENPEYEEFLNWQGSVKKTLQKLRSSI